MLRFVEWIKALEFAGYRRFVAHWRAIILLLILALATFLIAHADFFGLSLSIPNGVLVTSSVLPTTGRRASLSTRYSGGGSWDRCWPFYS